MLTERRYMNNLILCVVRTLISAQLRKLFMKLLDISSNNLAVSFFQPSTVASCFIHKCPIDPDWEAIAKKELKGDLPKDIFTWKTAEVCL